jgi:hypothetical protein
MFVPNPLGKAFSAVQGVLRRSANLSDLLSAATSRDNLLVSQRLLVVSQNSHGFSAGDQLKCTGNLTFAKAQADSAANGEIVGRVRTVINANSYLLEANGDLTAVGVPAHTGGTVEYLDPATAGTLTSTEPSTAGQVSKPVGCVLDSGCQCC